MVIKINLERRLKMKREDDYAEIADNSKIAQGYEERKEKIQQKNINKYGEEYHLRDRPSWICDLYFELDKFALGLRPNIRKEFLETYIKYSFRHSLFVYILIRKGEILRVWAKVPYLSLGLVPLFVRDYEAISRRPGVIITFDDQREFLENKEAMLKVTFEIIRKAFEGVASHKKRKRTSLKPVIKPKSVTEIERARPVEIFRPSINIVADSNGYLDIHFKIKKNQKDILNNILQETILK